RRGRLSISDGWSSSRSISTFPRRPRRFSQPSPITNGSRTGKKGTRVTIEKPGVPAPNGLGAVRKIRGGPLSMGEEIVLWDEPHAMDYRLIRGVPLRDHLGDLRFLPTPEGGTLLEYRIRYRVPWYAGGSIVGRLFGKQLERVIGNAMQRLALELKANS